MGYQNTTGPLQLPYPEGNEDLDIPGDLQLLAQTVDDNVSALIGDNVVQSAELFLTETPPTPNVEVIDGKMNIYMEPPGLTSKLDSSGGTITGNLQVDGELTFGAGGGITVPTPTASMDPVTLQYLEDQMFGRVEPFAIPAADLQPGWYVCDGTAHGNARLNAAIGPNTPDLRSKFIIGSTGEVGSHIRGQSYGSNTKTLTTNELPSHTHTINSGNATHTHALTIATGGGSKTPSGTIVGASTTHTHTGTSNAMNSNQTHNHSGSASGDGGHGHSINYRYNYSVNIDGTGSGYWVVAQVPYTGALITAGEHGHTVSVGNKNIDHTHGFTTGNGGGSHGHTFTGSALNIDHGHANSTANSENAGHDHTAVAAGTGNAFDITPSSYALIYAIFGGTV